MTVDSRTFCVVCAWRTTCTKRFKFEKSGLHCPDYSRDVTMPEEEGLPASTSARGRSKESDEAPKRAGDQEGERGLPAWEDED